MDYNEKTIEVKKIFDGKIIKLELQTVELCNNKKAEREIIRHNGGVAILPVTQNNEIILVRQFRKPYDEELLEIPAGKLEKGEMPEICAERELKEETGCSADKISFMTVMYPSPGYTDEKIYIYKAEGLCEGSLSLDEDEFLDVEKYTLIEAVQMIKTGIIKDAKSIIAILFLVAEINS
ncbi:MAG: ADP-ribose pyrophosphatase [Clostridiales bacterium GWB2_37_7]|nr:MAG: ADP-ribose pyrophosphatase [Clostridiales bacterium GWB2_37_7]